MNEKNIEIFAIIAHDHSSVVSLKGLKPLREPF